MKRLILIIVPVLALLASAAVLWQGVGPGDKGADSAPKTGASLIGGDFTLTSHTGKRVSARDFRGKYMLIYFGYTFCPEICPTELQTMTEAIDLLGKAGDDVVPILISVDPERDTVEKLAEYVPLFHKNLIGLTGTPEEIAKAAKAYRVYYAKAGEGAKYEMDHSAIIYLMDKKGQYAAHFAYGVKPEKMAEKIRIIMKKDGS
jgi:protein SCO1/2